MYFPMTTNDNKDTLKGGKIHLPTMKASTQLYMEGAEQKKIASEV